MEIFDYDNILLLPRKCRVESRSECDPSVEFGGCRFKLPVVPANLRTVIDERIAEFLAREGAAVEGYALEVQGHVPYRGRRSAGPCA